MLRQSASTAILVYERRDENTALPSQKAGIRGNTGEMRGGIPITGSAIQGAVRHFARKIREIFQGKPHVVKYAYDGVDRLTRITYPQAGNPYNTFEYNGDGLRVKMRAKTGAITRFVWSGSDVINEYSDNWTLQKSYYLGGGLEGQIAGTNYSYYHQDGLGSVVTMTNPSGNVTDTYDFDEFGTQIFNQGTTQNVYRYTGQQSDADSALLYLRARYYEPSTGRFITQDPKKGNIKEPTTFNLYMYCRNNPIRWIDPSGLDFGSPVPPLPPCSYTSGRYVNRFSGEYGTVWYYDPAENITWQWHGEDASHWNHWDIFKGKPYDNNKVKIGTWPQKSLKKKPNQKCPPYGDQSDVNPYPETPIADHPWPSQLPPEGLIP